MLVRVIIVYLLIPLVLFISAGDLGWRQGWIYSLMIVIAGVVPRILAEKRNPGIWEERGNLGKGQGVKSWDKLLSLLMALSFSYPLFIIAVLDHRFGWSPVFSTGLNILGFILIVIGYGFASWAFVENRFFSAVVRIQSDRGHEVCDRGPYRIVRHPGYAGNLLALPGIILAFGSLWTIIPAVAALIISLIRTSLEDRTLKEELPGYKDYALRVRFRLFPGIF